MRGYALLKMASELITQEVSHYIQSTTAHTVTPGQAHEIVETVKEKISEDKDLGDVFRDNEMLLAAWMRYQTEETHRAAKAKFIPIPRIKVTDAGVEEYGFIDFDIDYSDFTHVPIMSYAVVDIFDTVGTFLGTAQAGGMVNEEGEMDDMGKGLLADALAATTAGPMGTSTVTTYVESSLGFAEGAKTGMTPFVIGLLFLASVIFTPVVTLIPSVAIGPALIFVGALMIGSLKQIDFDDVTEGLPAFLTVVMMPLTYSIANGVAFGLIFHVILKLITGRKEDIKLPAVVVAILFILSYTNLKH